MIGTSSNGNGKFTKNEKG